MRLPSERFQCGARLGLVPLLAVLLSSCGMSAATPTGAGALPLAAKRAAAASPIKHIIIVVQENRSFDNVFDGFPGAVSRTYGYMHNGKRVSLQPIPFEVHDMDHYFETGVSDWDNGKMDGFDLNGTSGTHTIGAFAYSYLQRQAVAPYWAIAKNFVLADHMFPTMFGPSFTGHLTLVSGNANIAPQQSITNFPSADPWGCDAPRSTTTEVVDAQRTVTGNGPFPCFTQFQTLASTLDAASVSWRYYAPVVGGKDDGALWSSFDAIDAVRHGPDWSRNVVSPPQQILSDAASAKLAAVSWVVPDFLWSDHPYAGTAYGPSWVAAIVNAVGKSPEWKSTAIVVVWDDWGGFFDDVPPPQLDFRGLGIRVGCLIVSPYVKPHVVHDQYEFGSIVKFVEQTFGLPTLGSLADGYTDGRAKSIATSFDFTMTPRAFSPITAPYPPTFFLEHAPSRRVPDDE